MRLPMGYINVFFATEERLKKHNDYGNDYCIKRHLWGNPQTTDEFPNKGQVNRIFDVLCCYEYHWRVYCHPVHWNQRVAMTPILPSLVAPEIVIKTVCSDASDGKVGITTALMLACTVKPVYNDHRMGYFSTFWSPSRCAQEGRNC